MGVLAGPMCITLLRPRRVWHVRGVAEKVLGSTYFLGLEVLVCGSVSFCG